MAAATDEGDLVKAVIEEVRERLGKGDALAIALEKAGYAGKVSSRYSASVVSSWVTGRAMPGADVFLAAIRLAGISLAEVDERLHGGAATDRKERLRLARVERKQDELLEHVDQAIERIEARVEEIAGLIETSARLNQAKTQQD